MASGSEKRQRDKVLRIRCLQEEFKAIVAKADKAGFSTGAFARACLLDDPGPRAQRRPPADHKALRQILGHVGRIGNNINQIARALNTGGVVSQAELHEALTAYLDIRDAIFKALGKNPGPGK